MVRITDATEADVAAVAVLLDELDAFYGDTDLGAHEDRAQAIHDELFGSHPAARALLAWSGAACIGLATYSYLWPAAGVTRSLYLKELYVRESVRNMGVGRSLMRHLYRTAADNGCSRVEWTTDTDNPVARAFYGRLRVKELTTKIFYRVEGQDLFTDADNWHRT